MHGRVSLRIKLLTTLYFKAKLLITVIKQLGFRVPILHPLAWKDATFRS